MERCIESNKIIYFNKTKAMVALKSLQIKYDYSGKFYPCSYCCGFHVGREKEKAHKNKYKN